MEVDQAETDGGFPGLRIGISSIRNSDGGPNSAKRHDFISFIFIALQSALGVPTSNSQQNGSARRPE